MPAIVVDRVNFHYDDPYASIFEGLSLNIDTAWRTAIVGRNGKGKTTLLHLIGGQLQPRQGTVTVPVETFYFPYSPPSSDR